MKETWRKVTFAECGDRPPRVDVVPLSLACNHCADPACVKACPMKAISKEPEFGAVVNDPAKCIGCGACKQACPWHVPSFFEPLDKTPVGAPEHPRMTKCDMCVDRLKAGLKPACVASCPGRALECGPLEELRARHPGAKPFATGFAAEPARLTRPSVLFTPRKPRF
ncbi:MAG: 4Fe-4S dicluster domain-containing protein [Duodenibacillus sp.]|nr:4Fe-4S dicluster domain-containing protein [Duodenibacillus sp.]